MTMRITCLTAFALLTTVAAPRVAEACGGCFHEPEPNPSESTVVTGHRMVLSVSQQQTVLWDQITYAGNPEEFAWVLPVKEGARLEVGSDAFIDVLAAATNTTIGQPTVVCNSGGGDFVGGDDGGGFGCGCSADDSAGTFDEGGGGRYEEPPPDVNVVSQGTVGPYETVTLSTEVPGALDDWMDAHGYNVPEEIQPIIDDYVAEGFDFIALRLIPGNAVSQMQPVRVITPGAGFTLPLRMVAAGTGMSTAISLFVIGEGRYEAMNFANTIVDPADTVWDFDTSSSNYSELRAEALAANDGLTWLTSFARPGALFEQRTDPLFPSGQVSYQVGLQTATSLVEAMLRQADRNGDTGTDDVNTCLSRLQSALSSGSEIVDACDEEGNCIDLEPNQIAAEELACGDFDDIGVALAGMAASDAWITRLEAELPRQAFETDLIIQAAEQQPVENRVVAQEVDHSPCGPDVSTASLGTRGGKRRIPGGIVALTFGAAALIAGLRRRRRREEELCD